MERKRDTDRSGEWAGSASVYGCGGHHAPVDWAFAWMAQHRTHRIAVKKGGPQRFRRGGVQRKWNARGDAKHLFLRRPQMALHGRGGDREGEKGGKNEGRGKVIKENRGERPCGNVMMFHVAIVSGHYYT